MDLNDGEVMARAVDTPELFVQVFDRHGAAVHAFLSRRAGRQAADDVLGEVWLQAFRSRHRFDTTWTSARPWLYGIARNSLRVHARATSRAGTGESHSTDPWPDVDRRLDAARCTSALRAALSALEPEDLEVLLLVAWEDLTPTEAAVSLGIPAGTARWRLHRARAALREALEEREAEIATPESVMEV